ncbi:unnamed protein product [Arctogadus glacialis]
MAHVIPSDTLITVSSVSSSGAQQAPCSLEVLFPAERLPPISSFMRHHSGTFRKKGTATAVLNTRETSVSSSPTLRLIALRSRFARKKRKLWPQNLCWRRSPLRMNAAVEGGGGVVVGGEGLDG